MERERNQPRFNKPFLTILAIEYPRKRANFVNNPDGIIGKNIEIVPCAIREQRKVWHYNNQNTN